MARGEIGRPRVARRQTGQMARGPRQEPASGTLARRQTGQWHVARGKTGPGGHVARRQTGQAATWPEARPASGTWPEARFAGGGGSRRGDQPCREPDEPGRPGAPGGGSSPCSSTIRPMVVRYCRARPGPHHRPLPRGRRCRPRRSAIAVLSRRFRATAIWDGRSCPSSSASPRTRWRDAVRSASRLAVPTEHLPDGPDEHPGA